VGRLAGGDSPPKRSEPGGGTPGDAKAFVASEIVKWGPLIKKVNIRM